LKRSEFGAEEKALARHIDTGSNPRLFVILENFEGWERGADWNDLDFYISHGRKISRIAIVAEPRWEALALAFAGAGVRRTPVKFLPAQQTRAGAKLVSRVSCDYKRKENIAKPCPA